MIFIKYAVMHEYMLLNPDFEWPEREASNEGDR